jgi:hypothetical protein
VARDLDEKTWRDESIASKLMNDVWPFLVIALVIASIIQALRVQRRRRRDYREVLEPELQRLGYDFISSTTPGLFDVGPFPMIEFKIGRVRTRTPIGSGEYTEYRIVRFRRPNESVERESWVQLEFEAFRLRHTKWNPEPTQAQPAEGGNSEHHGGNAV